MNVLNSGIGFCCNKVSIEQICLQNSVKVDRNIKKPQTNSKSNVLLLSEKLLINFVFQAA